MTNPKSRILLVEDEADVRNLMILHLERQGYAVSVAEDGERGMKLYSEREFDLAILDWMLPGTSGLELCERMRGHLPILMVTARADAADIVQGLETGADDYITKPFELPVFLARVQALLRRANADLKADNRTAGALKLNASQHKAWVANDEIKLTISEFKLLNALLENKGRVLPRSKLIELVQGADVNVTDRTIDTHVFGLRKKLGPAADVIETIRGVGYRVRPE